MLKAYKYRIYPTEEQKKYIRQCAGATRWWHNYLVRKINEQYEKDKTHLTSRNINHDLVILKKEEETKWLKDVDSKSLIFVGMHLDAAYKIFFDGIKKGRNVQPPTIQKKKNFGSYTTYQSIKVDWKNSGIKIPKIKDYIKAVLHRKFDGQIRQITISFNAADQYFASILVLDGTEKAEEKTVTPESIVGIDLGIKNSVIVSDGRKFESLRVSDNDKIQRKIKILQRKLSKQEKYGKNYEKTRKKIAKKSNLLKNRRENYIHNITHDLAYDDNINAVGIEDLNVKGMMKNHHIAKSIGEASLYSIKEKLGYKLDWNGKKLVPVGRFFPSSKTCSKCGYIYKELKLSERQWTCPNCGEHHDRDVNAAINIRDNAYKILTDAKQ